METKNEEEIKENNSNTINNNEESKQNELLDEKLYKILFKNENSFNDNKTKLKLKSDYEYIIQIINQLEKEEFFNFVNYLNNIKIQISKVLINGFIEFDFSDENQNKIIIEIISKIIVNFFNKDLFNFIYKKLSKQYRKHNKITNIESLKKFEKLFKIWELLYNIKIDYMGKNKENISAISFITNENIKSKNIKIDLKKYISKYNENNNLFKIYINFLCSPILNINKFVDNFYFLKLENTINGTFEFKYKDIFNKNNPFSFSKVQTLIFYLNDFTYNIHVNNSKQYEKKAKFNFSLISEIKILNYFYGQISSIIIEKENPLNKKHNFTIIIINKPNKVDYDVHFENNEVKNKQKEQDLIQINGTIFSNDLNNKNKLRKIEKKKELNEIEYFGGFQSFIPLFKILKYIISNLGNKDNFTQENINDYMKKTIIWSKDILKIIFKLICLSENNYENFKKIIISLIGALSEISHSLNNLIDSNLISNEYKSILYKDEVIYTLFIIIINSEVPNNILNVYNQIFKVYDNWNEIEFLMDYIIIDIDNNENIDLYWYSSILLNIIIFNLLYFDSHEKIPKNLINQINKINAYINKKNSDLDKNQSYLVAINSFLSFINKFLEDKNDNYNYNFQIILEYIILLDENNYFFKFIINMIKIILKIKELEKINNINYKKDSFINTLNDLLKNFIFKNKNNLGIFRKKQNEIKNIFKYYSNTDLNSIFPFLTNEDLNSNNELLMNELIDYNGAYHHLMKELFVFNRLWSNQKLFFNKSYETIEESKLKYKNINYYTRNFQRPVIYPILDYKYRYPDFSSFNFEKKFYYNEDVENDYNFDLDCPELNKIIDEYNKTIFQQIKNNDEIKKYHICLIKQLYHVKGNLYAIKQNKELIIYFYGYPYDFENNVEYLLCCNRKEENNKNNICYGSIFKCHKKEKNKKIKINLNNIRMILKRNYCYRESGLEIFTETKSYYFNFYSQKELNNFLDWIKDIELCPIIINNKKIGYIRLNADYIKDNNNFIEYILNLSKEKLYDICNFDLIILINLISNRSYIDLNQYPVFPLLFFYENRIKKERNFEKHIGFQTSTIASNIRKNAFLTSYNIMKDSETQENGNNNIYYFNTHYSNCMYTSYYLIRIFPYSFCAIELQGDGFDNPNRLFYSIEDSFFNVSSQKTDLRELIPEFFYLPEMFININFLFLKERRNKEPVNDVKMPNNILISKYYKEEEEAKYYNELDKYNEIDSNGFNLIINKNKFKEDFLKIFIFVDYMKKELESSKEDICSWLNIIFGEGQRFINNGKEKEQLFRTESYLDIDENTYKKYSKSEIIMKSIEFGLSPLQTIFDPKIFHNFENKKNNYEKIQIENVKIKKKRKSIIKNEKEKDWNIINIIKKNNDIEIKDDKNLDKKINVDFQIDDDDNFGKLKVYIDNILISEIIDHSDKIIDIFYNIRLNMFVTTSYDGLVCIYLLPNKLFSIIKHPQNLYFDKVYLSSNPFPTIITFENGNNILRIYTLSGMLIKKKQIIENQIKIKIDPLFNMYGGTTIDRIKIYNDSFTKIYNLPFLDEIKVDK